MTYFFKSQAFQTKSGVRRAGQNAKINTGARLVRYAETDNGWFYFLYT